MFMGIVVFVAIGLFGTTEPPEGGSASGLISKPFVFFTALALMAIGVIMRDGLAVIAGALLGLLWVAMLGYVLVFLGTEGLDAIKETIISFL